MPHRPRQQVARDRNPLLGPADQIILIEMKGAARSLQILRLLDELRRPFDQAGRFALTPPIHDASIHSRGGSAESYLFRGVRCLSAVGARETWPTMTSPCAPAWWLAMAFLRAWGGLLDCADAFGSGHSRARIRG